MCSNLYPTALFLTMRNQASAASEGWKDVLGHFKGQDQNQWCATDFYLNIMTA